ncbi:MAG TPA: endo-1,4-beta-xylanase [Opitutus sp.]|nr:endo-1,4-beta-xylanase [Opitutus sp.]
MFRRSLPVLFAVNLAAALGAFAETPAAAVEPYAPQAPESATLKDTFKSAFLVGAALNPRQFSDTDPRTTDFITSQFNCATAENDMKWELVEPKPDEFHFAEADKFIDFCNRHHLVIIGHNLCWHAQLPSWVSKPDPGQETLTKEVLLARLHNHIKTVASHFKGQVLGWDVVNEAIADGTGEYRDDVFYRVIGKEYLALAFKWAHEADPSAQLYYNEYNLDVDPKKRARAVELVKYLREQGAHIDGIGLQGHYNLTAPTPAEIDETIQTFADLGLKVMFTELDVEAIRDRRVSGAVDANNGARQRPRFQFFPTTDELKSKLKLTDAQAAQITPLFESATKNIQTAIAASEFGRIREIRTDTLAAVAKVLDDSQRPTFTEMTRTPPWERRGPPPKPLTPEQQRELAQRYGEIFDVLLKHRSQITRVTFWGVRDADSWRRRGSPLLFGDNFERKPAYDAVIAAAKKAGL